MFTGQQVGEVMFWTFTALLAVLGVVWRLNATLKRDLHGVIGDLRHSHDTAVKEMRTTHAEIGHNVSTINLQINTILEGSMRRLEERIQRLESGQDEWTKALRQRTHDLGDTLNRALLEIALIKAGLGKKEPPA